MQYLTDAECKLPYAQMIALAQERGAYVGPSTHTTRWSPDTCGCCLDQIAIGSHVRIIDDRKNVREVFIHDPNIDIIAGECIEACECHANYSDAANHYECVLEENQRKNRFYAAIIKEHSEIKDLSAYVWSFDQNRNLVVDVSAYEQQVAASVRAIAMHERFVNKVIVRG